jgi:hypothetical protein
VIRRGLRLMVLGRLRVMLVVRGLRLMVLGRLRVMQAVGMVEQVRGRVAVMEAVGNDVWGLRRVSTCLPAGGARTHAASS